jgi:hypothetical protein
MKRVGYSFTTYDPLGEEAMDPLPWRVPFQIVATRPRNLDRLKLYHTLITVVAKGLGQNHDDVDAQVRINLGYFEEARLPSGVIIPRPTSISYENMPDESTFIEFFEKAIQAVYVLYGILPADARRKIDELLAPKTERRR